MQLYRRDLRSPGYKVLGRGVEAWRRSRCAREVAGSHGVSAKGRSLLKEGEAGKWRVSAVLKTLLLGAVIVIK